MLKVYFNNQELTKYITVLKGFTAFDGAEYKPSITEYPTLNGEIFNYTKRGAKKINMPFYVKYRNVEDYDKLQSILNVKKPFTSIDIWYQNTVLIDFSGISINK